MTAVSFSAAAFLLTFLGLGIVGAGAVVFALTVLVTREVERGEREP